MIFYFNGLLKQVHSVTGGTVTLMRPDIRLLLRKPP